MSIQEKFNQGMTQAGLLAQSNPMIQQYQDTEAAKLKSSIFKKAIKEIKTQGADTEVRKKLLEILKDETAQIHADLFEKHGYVSKTLKKAMSGELSQANTTVLLNKLDQTRAARSMQAAREKYTKLQGGQD